MPNNFQPPAKGQSVADFIQQQSLWQKIHDNIDLACKLEKQLKQIPRPRSQRQDKTNPIPKAINCTDEFIGGCFPIVGYESPYNVPPSTEDPNYQPAFCNDFDFCIRKPTDSCCFGVLACTIPPNGIAPITMGGIAHVRLDLKDKKHDFVQAIPNDTTKLKSVGGCQCNGGKILWKEKPDTVGEQWAVIYLLPNQPGMQEIERAPVDIPTSTTDIDFGKGVVPVCAIGSKIVAGTLVLLIPGKDKCQALELCS